MSMRGVDVIDGRKLLTRGPIAGGIFPDPLTLPGFDGASADIFSGFFTFAELFTTLPSMRIAFARRDAAAATLDGGSFSLMPGKRFSGSFPMSDICVCEQW